MARLRHTKNELKKQKESLKRYNQYLPTLLLKKQQLQTERFKIHTAMEDIKKQRAYLKAEVYEWADVFAEKVSLEKLIALKEITTTTGNIAGIDIPVFEKTVFTETKYDFARMPLWVDYAMNAIKKVITMNAKMEVLKKQDALVHAELRVTTQRVNLFEKVKIPDAERNINKIQISLGDAQTAAVVTGKIAKAKILKAEHD